MRKKREENKNTLLAIHLEDWGGEVRREEKKK